MPRLGTAPLYVSIHIPETGNENSFDVEVPDRIPSGTLNLRLREPDGWGVEFRSLTVTGPCRLYKSLGDDEPVHIPPGTYSVTVEARMVTPWEKPAQALAYEVSGPVIIREGEETILDGDWTPPVGQSVLLTALDGTEGPPQLASASFRSRGGGRLRFGLPLLRTGEWLDSRAVYDPGVYELVLEVDGHRRHTEVMSLSANTIARAEIELVPDR